VAVLDTKGNVLNLTSIREAKRSDLIKHVLSFGRPIAVASDVNPLPRMIEKLAAALGSKVYFPKVSLTNLEKEKIINDFEDDVENSHQKDALAAGLKAFRNHHELFLKIEETLEKQGKEEMFDEVIEEFLKDETQNIIEVIKRVLKRKKR
jgi:hypothetical protein